MGNKVLLFTLSLGAASLALSQNVRLSNDVAGGYTSVYTLATGTPYSDSVLAECSIARGRQNEPSVAVDPRNTQVLIGSSNDYCGVYAGSTTTFVLFDVVKGTDIRMVERGRGTCFTAKTFKRLGILTQFVGEEF